MEIYPNLQGNRDILPDMSSSFLRYATILAFILWGNYYIFKPALSLLKFVESGPITIGDAFVSRAATKSIEKLYAFYKLLHAWKNALFLRRYFNLSENSRNFQKRLTRWA
jgi:hypothetical protein